MGKFLSFRLTRSTWRMLSKLMIYLQLYPMAGFRPLPKACLPEWFEAMSFWYLPSSDSVFETLEDEFDWVSTCSSSGTFFSMKI